MSRRIVWLLAISTGCIVANIYYAQPLLADMAHEFGLSVPQIGAVAMLSQIGSALGMLMFVPLGDKFERRDLIATLLIAEAAALVVTANASSVLWLCLGMFAIGAGTSNVHVVVPLAAHLAPPQQRGHVVGTVLGGLLVGVLLARVFSGFVGARFGWRAVYWIGALVVVTLAAVIRLWLPISKPDESPRWPELMRSILSLVREHATVREAALLAFLMYSTFAALWTTLVFLLRTPPYDYGTTAAGVFGLLGATSASAAPLVGRFADRYGAKRAVHIAIVTTLVAYLVMLVGGRTLPGLIAAIILIDAGVQSGHVANQSRIYSLVPTARGRLNTVYMMAFMSGGAVGSYVGPLGFKLGGWTGFCVYPIAALTFALVYAVRADRSTAVEPASNVA